jgi:predicted O-linked N-acetylglucosamine transferase (SPINDLY family)
MNSESIREQLGDWPAALAEFLARTRADPAHPEPWFSAGAAYWKMARRGRAAACFRKAMRLGLADPKTLHFIATAFWIAGRSQDGLTAFRQAVFCAPADAELRLLFASALMETENYAEALDHCRAVVLLQPNEPGHHVALAQCLAQNGRLSEALAAYRQALEWQPDNGAIWNNLSHLFLYSGDQLEGLHCLRKATELSPHPEIHSNLLMALHYVEQSDELIFHEHLHWAGRHHPSSAAAARERQPRLGSGRLRIGYVSGDFRNHSVALLIGPILRSHDRAVCTVIAFSTTLEQDSVTHEIQATVDEWYCIAGLDDCAAADLIRSLDIDILVDLSGHTAGNRLGVFARKPAPIQATYCGYPNTTGLRAIDYRITDSWCDPPGVTDHLHAERLIRLDCGFICYQPPDHMPPVSPSPCYARGYVTFACFAGAQKITRRMIAVWADILNRVPESRLVLKCATYPEVAGALLSQFESLGIHRGRLTIHELTKRTQHLELYAGVDVALDTYPYAGTVGTCEALWMGVPVISLAGTSHLSRVGVSLLARAGLTECIANTLQEYVDTAVSMAQNRDRLAMLRAALRSQVATSSLGDPRPVTRALEHAYRQMWRDSLTAGSAPLDSSDLVSPHECRH